MHRIYSMEPDPSTLEEFLEFLQECPALKDAPEEIKRITQLPQPIIIEDDASEIIPPKVFQCYQAPESSVR